MPSRAFKTATEKVTQLVDWFIPAELARDKETLKQVRVFLISHLFGPFLGNTVPLALFLLDPSPGLPVFVLCASITGFWIFPFLLRRTASYNLLAMISVENLIFCILWSCYFYGGLNSPTLPWVLVIPLLAFFYIGPVRKLRLWVLGLFAANVVAVCALYVFVYAPQPDLPEVSRQGLGIVSTVATCLYVTMMSYYYARTLASQVELEAEVKRHLATSAMLRQATADAERADAAKSEFLARTSHELRTPLNAVIGYSEMLMEDAELTGDNFGVEDLERIHSSGKRLLSLVSDVLDLSKITAGKMELFREEADLAPLVVSTITPYATAARQAGLTFEVTLDGGLGSRAVDVQKLRQVITHLVDNAVKFCREGRIEVHVSLVADGSMLQVEVSDTGIGIAPERMPLLFESFQGAEDYSSSHYGGAGVGLGLSERLCRLMGGDLTVRSTFGEGSTFTARIRIGDAPAIAAAPAETAGLVINSTAA